MEFPRPRSRPRIVPRCAMSPADCVFGRRRNLRAAAARAAALADSIRSSRLTRGFSARAFVVLPQPVAMLGSDRAMNNPQSWDRAAVEAIANSLKDKPGALMVILRRVQDALGWVPHDSVPIIA